MGANPLRSDQTGSRRCEVIFMDGFESNDTGGWSPTN